MTRPTQVEVTYVLQNGERRTIQSPAGTSLMRAALQNGVPGIVAECGGACACATCHVYVDASWLSHLEEAQETECEMLDCAASERQANSRLSCQIKLTPALSGLTVTVAEQFG